VEVAQGRVSDRPFARTIYSIARQRFTGDLVLRDGDRRYKLSWEDGRVVAAESAAPADSAGRVALAAGLGTSTDVARALDAIARSPGADPLEVLTEQMRLKPDQVALLKRRLLAQRAARAFALPDGSYVLDNARSLRADPEVPPLDARWLVYFGLRMHYTAERLERELGVLIDRGLRLADDAGTALPAFSFGESERPVMDRLAMRAWTPRQLLDACPGMDGSHILSVVYALLACDCLEQGIASPSPTLPPPLGEVPAARGTETRPPTQPGAAAAGGDAARRARGVSSAPAPAVPGAAEHARLAHGTVRRLLFPGQGTNAPPTGEPPTPRARRTSSPPLPSPTPPAPPGADPPAPRTRTSSHPPASTAQPPAPRTRTSPSSPPPPAPVTQPPRTRTSSVPPPVTQPPTSRTRTSPSSPPPPATQPRTRTSPSSPPPASSGVSPSARRPTASPYARLARETSPPPMGRSSPLAPSKTPTLPPPSRPHSTTVPPILRRVHSTTGSIPPESMTGAAAEIRRMIGEKVQALERGADHYSILGVTQMAKADEIRAAYFAIAKRIHPDRLRAVGVTDVTIDAQRLFARINQAFGVLSDPQRRAEYSVMLSAGGEDAVRKAQAEAEERAGRVLRAEDTFRHGEMALRRSQFEQARVLFMEAVELNPDEAEYHALLAWAIWLAAPEKTLVAIDVQKRLAQSLALSPQCVQAHFYGGQVAKQSGQMQAAVDAFRKVIEMEPGHTEANLELRVLRGRLKKK